MLQFRPFRYKIAYSVSEKCIYNKRRFSLITKHYANHSDSFPEKRSTISVSTFSYDMVNYFEFFLYGYLTDTNPPNTLYYTHLSLFYSNSVFSKVYKEKTFNFSFYYGHNNHSNFEGFHNMVKKNYRTL